MIPVTQTILADPVRNDGHDAEGRPGNCYQAALASVLELPLDAVPHFATFTDEWQEQSEAWLRGRGLARGFYYGEYLQQLVWPFVLPPEGLTLWDGITPIVGVVGALGAGPSPRGNFRHVVVLDLHTGNTIHDPHPSGAGLDLIDEVEVIFEVAR